MLELHIERVTGLLCSVVPEDDDFLSWSRLALTRDERWEVGLKIVNEEEMRDFNCKYRGIDKPTNVLSFPADLPPGIAADDLDLEVIPLGDLVICAPIVQLEAEQQGKDLRAHWAHMTIHGMLHLQGFDHVLEEDAVLMENREREILEELGFPDPYAAATA